jgi:MSHA biogenesis protein MshO
MIGRPQETGFTLIELVIVITVLGILAAASAGFLRGPIASYFETERRVDLAAAGDLTLAKLRQDVGRAVPNGVRVINAGGGFWIELLPVRSAGRYRAGGTGDVLSFGLADTGFDVLGPPVAAQAGDWVVVNNYQPTANVWTGTSRAAYTGAAGLAATVQYAAHVFAADAPDRHFQIATDPVSYACDPVAGTLRRISNYGGPAPAQPTAFGAGAQNDLLATGVERCRASAVAGTLRRGEAVAVEIGFLVNGDRLTVSDIIRVETPP